MGLLSYWREWFSTNLTPGGRNGESWATRNRVYGGKSVARGALHPHFRVYSTSLNITYTERNSINETNYLRIKKYPVLHWN